NCDERVGFRRRHDTTLELQSGLAARGQQPAVRRIGREQVPLCGDVAADEIGNARAEQWSDEMSTLDVVRGVEAERPAVGLPLEPPEIVDEARNLELDVVGMVAFQQVGALEAVVENGEATLVVGVARRVERCEQVIHRHERRRHGKSSYAGMAWPPAGYPP